MRFPQKINHLGFTLFELMISMTVFGMLMIIVLDAVANIGIARTKSMTRITLLEELYFFSEKLAATIKDGGIVDYEEYWNRQMVGTGTSSGHYLQPTGYGNYGRGGALGSNNYGTSGKYLCRSADNGANKMGTGGCITANLNDSGVSQQGEKQKYGQYALQYTDYNGNYDNDGPAPGNEDGDLFLNITEDEDDKDIGDGPIVLSGSTPELYLYNPLTKERVFFRWIFRDDPGLPPGTCITTGVNAGSGCLGNIEMLRLIGKDIGLDHTGTTSLGAFDGEIDTWICHPDLTCYGPDIPSPLGGGKIPRGTDDEWIKMFPDYVNVKNLSFYIYPLKDPWKSWSATDCFSGPSCISPFIQPYVRIQMTLGLAWEKRKVIRGDDPIISISTTISLSHTNIE